jgi:ABC-type multidrug transport system fused ATPase/permease subunit
MKTHKKEKHDKLEKEKEQAEAWDGPPEAAGTEKYASTRVLVTTVLHYLAPYLRARWTMLAGAAMALVSVTAVELLKPWPLKFVFDYLLQDRTFLPAWATPAFVDQRTWLLVFVCGLIVSVWLLSSVSAYLKEYLLSRLGEEVAFELRVRVFGHIQRLSLAFHDSRRIGDMLMRVTRDADSVRELIGGSLLQWLTAMAALVGTLVMMLVVDWQLGLLGLVTAAVMAPIEWRLKRRIKEASKEKREREVGISSVTEETMSALRLVRAFGRETYQQQQFGHESTKSVKAGVELSRLSAQYIRTVDMVSAMATCAMVWFGVQRVLRGEITAGELYLFVAYVKGLHGPLRDIAKQGVNIAKGRIGLERVVEVLETDAGVQDAPNAKPAPRFRGAIEFRNVSFGYRSGRPVLHDVNLHIEPGEVVALVGYSGAGKSTILSLIPRLYDATGGRILIDGHDIRELTIDSLRQEISFVLQDSVLFQTSIMENIRYGRPGATPQELAQAALLSGVDQFVSKLPDRYRTAVGPRGVTLSGGERQRVAIARAMIRNAPILLLDEPTTGLDVESEKLVMDALERLMVGRTTLLISHKLSLIERVDKVFVIDGGRVVEAGSPAELRAAGGTFARLSELAASSGVIEDRPEPPLAKVNG